MTRQEHAAQAAHKHARAILDGDYGTMVRGMTPDALAQAMLIGNTTWTDFSYELAAAVQDGDDFVFDVTFHTDQGPLVLRERFSEVDGSWKLVDIARTS